MKLLNCVLAIVFCTTGCYAIAQAPKSPTSVAHAPAKPLSSAERGERVFKVNCSRCHYAPDALNPRITGTVIRHMRVRANLSQADESDIRRYLNP